MPTPLSSPDLGRMFDARILTRGRSLGLANGVEVHLNGDAITGIIQDGAFRCTTHITPASLSRRVVFNSSCTCRVTGFSHLAALDRFPALRKLEQQTFLDVLVTAAPERERQRTVFELAQAEPPQACIVTTMLIGERSGIVTPTTPRQIAGDEKADPAIRDLAYLIGDGTETRTGIPASLVVDCWTR